MKTSFFTSLFLVLGLLSQQASAAAWTMLRASEKLEAAIANHTDEVEFDLAGSGKNMRMPTADDAAVAKPAAKPKDAKKPADKADKKAAKAADKADNEGRFSKELVLPLEGFLVQGIPLALRDTVDSDNRLQTSNGFYAIRAGAREFISETIAQNYKLHIISNLGLNEATEITKNFELKGGKKLSAVVEDIKGGDDLKDGNISGDKFKIQGAFIVVTTSEFAKMRVASEAVTLDLGQVYFHYRSFEEATKNRITTGPKADYFPKTEKEWIAEFYKAGRVYIDLVEANKGGKFDFINNLRILHQEDEGNLSLAGIQMLDHKGLPVTYRLKMNADNTAVSACEVVDVRHGEVKGTADLAKCLEDGTIVKAWTNRQRQDCAAFTTDNIYIIGHQEGCGDTVAFKVKDKTVMFAETAETKKLSATELEKYLDGPLPTERDPYQLFEKYNDKPNAKTLNLSHCRTGGWQTMNKGSTLTPECQPDTLYSWGPMIKIKELKNFMGNGAKAWTSLSRNIFFARSAISTFGYGEVPIRVKLKAGVKFKSSDFACQGAADREIETTVFYRDDGYYSDWVICSPKVIASWSYERPKHYDEMIKDFRRHSDRSHKAADVDYYSFDQNSVNTIFSDYGGPTVDYHDFSLNFWQRNLLEILKHTKAGDGEIMYNPDLPASEKTEEAHFRTAHPIYFNEE
jgi:hypothetical protein